MINHLLELRLKYNANVTKFKKITSMHYAVMTSAINVLVIIKSRVRGHCNAVIWGLVHSTITEYLTGRDGYVIE